MREAKRSKISERDETLDRRLQSGFWVVKKPNCPVFREVGRVKLEVGVRTTGCFQGMGWGVE